ncbi:hypothetical protein GOEFS_040_00120 [Gordonia effusa NBRC 100432]|uniref:Uncharacterized protein n=1 Tax=Gordonia effusa NBRC 100432 TaxID=1077974 RepID=H0QYE1_9ACTN|nr:hypothetical protein [Gordonia effusa]GAB17842.1 hypothetical protein GOEFS_040_00120 [Gordonia effusa NBRC 100432]
MRKLMICGAAAAAAVVAGTTVGAASAPAATKGDVISFSVASATSWGTISYYNGVNLLRQQHDFKLTEKGPDGLYRRTITFPSSVPRQILGLRMQSEGTTARCQISVNGKVHSRGVAHGFRPSALCS